MDAPWLSGLYREGFYPSGVACHKLFVPAHLRIVPIVGQCIGAQHIFHRRYKAPIYFLGETPRFTLPRLKFIFFRRSCTVAPDTCSTTSNSMSLSRNTNSVQ